VPQRVLRTRFPELDLTHVTFSSDAVRRGAAAAGLPVASAPIIHCAVDVEEFPLRPPLDRVERFLYVGQIMRHKGVKTAVDAFIELCAAHPQRPLSLTLVGGAINPKYEADLHRHVEASPAAERIHFAGPVSKNDIAAVYAEHDALIFPSEWDEPFSLVLMEAMASGLPVVSTLTGGTPEIAVPDQNVLAFPKGDSRACSAQLERLLDIELANRLRVAGRETIEAGFTIDVMVDRVEASLLRAARREQPSDGGLRGGESSRESIRL
jgi:type III pantothenate kinase